MIKHRDSMLNSLLAKENRETSFFIVNKFVKKKLPGTWFCSVLRKMNVYFPEQKLGVHFLDRVHMQLDVDFT